MVKQGLLATDDQWFDKLEALVLSPELRQNIAESAYRAVLENCTLSKKDEMVTYFEQNKQIKVENLFFILATIFIFSFMLVFPINRVPDETNHARMTWETFHKPTLQSFKWMNEIPRMLM